MEPVMLNGLNFSWHVSWVTLIGLLILCVLYVEGVRVTRKNNPPLNMYRVMAFGAAIVLIALVLLTPLDTIARTQLFAAHMIQSVILTTLCAPLLLAACSVWLLEPFVN